MSVIKNLITLNTIITLAVQYQHFTALKYNYYHYYCYEHVNCTQSTL